MTGVYSGGLVYEYSNEANEFGLVQISGSTITKKPDFSALQKAYSGTPNPSGDGGYTTSNKPSQCPGKSSTWLPGTDALPAMPVNAAKFLTSGAGTGPGLKGNDGKGSQYAGSASSGTATAGSGQASSTGSSGSSGSSNAAATLRVPDLSVAPFALAMVVGLFTLVGASLV